MQRLSSFHLAVAVLATLALAACGHVPVATVVKLVSFDVSSAEPGDIRAAVRYPAALVPRPSGAKLTITHRLGIGPNPSVETFVLEEIGDAKELTQLDRFKRGGYPVTAFRLKDEDLPRVKTLQTALRRSPNSGGQLGVSIEACHRGGLPPGALLSSTYLKLDRSSGYLVVFDDVDLRKEIPAAELAAHIPPCSG